MERYLITGGTGFVGARLALALLARGDRVAVLGRAFERVPEILAAGAEPIKADLRDAEAVAAACVGRDAVVHSGALSAPWGARRDFEAINIGGTRHVIAGCRRHGVGRLVLVSSPSIAFDGRPHRLRRDDEPLPERTMAHYSATKRAAEALALAANSPELAVVALRPKAIFGPGDTTLLPRLIAAARRGRLPQIGDGTNRVDLTYIDNVVYALVLALGAKEAAGKAYTITNGEHVLLWDIIRTVLRELGISTELRRIPARLAVGLGGVLEALARVTGREPTLTRYSAALLAVEQTYDISAATRDLGYVPQISVEEGVRRTIEQLKQAERKAQ